MRIKFSILFIFLTILVTAYYFNSKTDAVENCSGGTCTTKEIGNISPTNPNNFIASDNLDITKEWWVKITAKGRSTVETSTETTYYGADIMLIADVTGSMISRMPDGVRRIDALKNALNKFLEQSRNEDYIGIGTFAYCNQYNNSVPMSWSYEGTSSSANGAQRKFGSLIFPLQRFEGKKATYQSFVSSLDLSQNGGSLYINYCNTQGDVLVNGRLAATTVGAGLTVANSQLTNLFNTSAGSAYRNSSKGTNPGPLARGSLPGGVTIPKYIILMSDGEENVDPRAADEEIDDRGFSRIQTAKNTGAKIYTILLGDVNNTSAANLLEDIASTPENFYKAPSNDELDNIYRTIRESITETSTIVTTEVGLSSLLNEKINASYFNILPPTDDTFRLYKTDNGVRSRINCNGDVIANCGVSNSSPTGFDIQLPKGSSTDTFEVWFKVKITQPGNNVNVNEVIDGAGTSKIRYENGYEETVGNTQVDLIAKDPYFNTSGGGNLYTVSGIQKNLIPENRKLLESQGSQSHGIFYRGNDILNLGGSNQETKISDAPIWNAKLNSSQYVDTAKFKYTPLLESIERVSALDDVNNILTKNRGVYKTTGSATISNPINYPAGVRRNWHVVFVDGDLFIRNNIKIPNTGIATGTSGIVFVVRGNIGISTSVTELQGIYIAEGTIDTSCNSSTFSGRNCSSTEASRNTPLRVEGNIISTGETAGIITERKNPNADEPSEQFVFRPDLLLMATSSLGNVNYSWTETAPEAISP